MDDHADEARSMMLDGNAAAGMLYDVFAREMTITPTECASCGKHAQLGELMAFMRAPGLILRCPACEAVMLRITRIGEQIYLDARGAVYLRLSAA